MKSRTRSTLAAVSGIGLILTLPAMAETLNEIRFYGDAGGGVTGVVPNNTTSPGVIPGSLPGAGNAGFVTGATGILPNTATGTPHGLTREAGAGAGGSDRYTMTAAGSDFWGSQDRGAYAFDNGAAGQSGNFSAIVRNVSVAGNPADYLAPNWGRTGLGARVDVNNNAGLTVNTIRETAAAGAIAQTARGVLGEGDNDNNRQVLASGGPNGDVRTNAIWMGLHRYNGVLYSTWAPDVGGAPGTWSVSVGNAFGGNALSTGTLQVGLLHQAHTEDQPGGPNGNKVNSAVFDGFRVDNPGNNGNFLNDLVGRGQFPNFTTRAISAAPNGDLRGSANGSELGIGGAGPVSWKVEVLTAPTPGLHNDIYVGPNLNNQALWNAHLAGNPAPYYSGKVTRNSAAGTGVYWDNSVAYPVEWQAGGSFLANQENYSARTTGQIFLPEVGTYNLRDGNDDYSFLSINGQVLVDDNNWVGVAGIQTDGTPEGSPTGTFNATAPGWYNIDFRMAEGGGGDNIALYWDYLPDDINDPSSGGQLNANGAFTSDINLALGQGALVPDGYLRSFEGVSMFIDDVSAINDAVFVDENGNRITLPVGDHYVRFTVDGVSSIQLITVVPEPATTGLFAIGLGGLLLRRRRK